MQKSEFKEIDMDVDEFCIVMRNVDAWERMKNVKFVEADIEGDKAKVKVMPVSSPGFFIWSQKGEVRLMAEVISDTRIGYIDLEELAEFDEELLEQLKQHVIRENNGIFLSGRCFPKSNKSVNLFNSLMKTAKWKKHPIG
jgi:uncharacterized membrane protein YcaP (DUF421 family)